MCLERDRRKITTLYHTVNKEFAKSHFLEQDKRFSVKILAGIILKGFYLIKKKKKPAT